MKIALFLRSALCVVLLVESLAPAAHAARQGRAVAKVEPRYAAFARLDSIAARVSPALIPAPAVVKRSLVPAALDSVAKEAAPPPPVQGKLAAASLAAVEAAKPGVSEAKSAAALQEVWTGQAKHSEAEPAPACIAAADVSAASPAAAMLAPAAKRGGRALRALGLAALVPALGVATAAAASTSAGAPAPIELPAWLVGAVSAVFPYAKGIATLFGAHYANQGARWAITRLGETFGWKENTTAVVRLVAGVSILAGGAAMALHFMGMPTDALLTTFGVGGVAMTMAAKDFIGNFLEGVKVLIKQPFQMGDYMLIGGKLVRANDMSLQHLKLDTYGKSVAYREYTDLAGLAITVFREHVPQLKFKSPKGLLAKTALLLKLAVANAVALTREIPKPDLKKTGMWAAAAGGLLYGLPKLRELLVDGWFQSLFPFLQGGAVFFAAHSLQKWLGALITVWGQKRGWHPQKIVLVKLLVQGGVFAVGGPIALSMMGFSMTSFLAYIGASGVVIGWATSDILGNVIKAFRVMGGKKIQVGDIVEFGTVQGKVVDLDWNYLIIEHADKSHSLIPYSMTKNFTLMHPDDADPSAPKPTDKKKVTLGGVTGVLVEFGMNGAVLETDGGEKVTVSMERLKAEPFHKEDFGGAVKEAAAK